MQCRCMGCIDKIDKAMAAIRTFTGTRLTHLAWFTCFLLDFLV